MTPLQFGLWILTQSLSSVTISEPVDGAGQIAIVCIADNNCAIGITQACDWQGSHTIAYKAGWLRRGHIEASCDHGALQLESTQRLMGLLQTGHDLRIDTGGRVMNVRSRGADGALNAQSEILESGQFRKAKVYDL